MGTHALMPFAELKCVGGHEMRDLKKKLLLSLSNPGSVIVEALSLPQPLENSVVGVCGMMTSPITEFNYSLFSYLVYTFKKTLHIGPKSSTESGSLQYLTSV